jgi:hypothetical protein
MTRSEYNIPRLSLAQALLISLGPSPAHGLGAVLDGPHADVPVPVQVLGRQGRAAAVPALDGLVHLHARAARVVFYFLLSSHIRGRLSVAARLVIATGIECAWEVFENTPMIINRYRTKTISNDYFGDTIVNSVGDILSMIVGFLLAARLPAWVTVFLFIATEVVMFMLLRDNLTLNVIMLVYRWSGSGSCSCRVDHPSRGRARRIGHPLR